MSCIKCYMKVSTIKLSNKMKFVAVMLGVLTGASCQTTNKTVDGLMSHPTLSEYRNITEVVETLKLINDICPAKYDNIGNAIEEAKMCFSKMHRENHTVCELIQDNVEKCVQSLISFMKECMPEMPDDIPEIILTGIVSAADFVCKLDAERTIELTNKCLNSVSSKLKDCIKKLNAERDLLQKNPEKPEICPYVQPFRRCIEEHLNVKCNNIIAKEIGIRVYDALYKGCNQS